MREFVMLGVFVGGYLMGTLSAVWFIRWGFVRGLETQDPKLRLANNSRRSNDKVQQINLR